jgi:cytochrome c-type biogenesis protein CcmH
VSAFWLMAAAMTLLVVGVLAVPLLKRTLQPGGADQDRSNVALYHDQLAELERDRAQGVLSEAQFEQAKMELGRRLLADVGGGDAGAPARAGGRWRYAALACVPVVAAVAYLALGTPLATDPALLAAHTSADQTAQLHALVERLRSRLAANPEDAEASVLLARSLLLLGRTQESADVYARAVALVPDSPQVHADYADVLVRAADGVWSPQASAALAKALALDGSNPKALWLAGAEAYARNDYGAALGHWEKLAPMAEPGSEVARIIEQNLSDLRARIAAAPAVSEQAVKPAAAAAPGAQAATNAVSGVVTLDAKLAREVRADDIVFVFARAASGPKMPLAIRRVRAAELPYRFTLDDGAAMAPGMTISAFPEVVIGARVSRSGDAARKPGDLEGVSRAVRPGAKDVEVRIDARVE